MLWHSSQIWHCPHGTGPRQVDHRNRSFEAGTPLELGVHDTPFPPKDIVGCVGGAAAHESPSRRNQMRSQDVLKLFHQLWRWSPWPAWLHHSPQDLGSFFSCGHLQGPCGNCGRSCPKVMASHCCLMFLTQSSHGLSSCGQVDSSDAESHGSRARARIRRIYTRKVWPHVHASRGLPSHGVGDRQSRRNVCQSTRWTCSDMASDVSPDVC